MKTLVRCSVILLSALASVSGIGYAQDQSDYAIVQGYQSKYKEILKQINQVQTVQECADVQTSIDDLERAYVDHRDLLNQSLYPDKFDEQIMKARVQLRLFQEKIGVIESQVVKIAQLESQVRQLSASVDSLSTANSALMGNVKNLEENVKTTGMSDKKLIDSLMAMISKLQNGLRERDQMIFSLVDSLFLQYDKDVTMLKDVEKQRIVGKVEKNGVLGHIQKSLEDNLAFVQSTDLTAPDLAKIMSEQQRFAGQWKGLGGKLTHLYSAGKQRTKEMQNIDTLLARWDQKATSSFWVALGAMFRQNSIDLGTFSDGNGFYRSFTARLDSEIQNPAKEGNDARYKRYTNFEGNIWKGVSASSWLPMLVSQGKLTEDQRKDIEKKVDDWKGTVSPPSTTLYIAIFLVIVVLLAALYVRMRKGKPAT